MKTFQWMVVCLLVSLGGVWLAVWMPAAVKKLGLFSFALGGLLGLAYLKASGTLGVSLVGWRRLSLWGVASLVELGRILETFRLYEQAQRVNLQRQLAQQPGWASALTDQLQQKASPGFLEFLRLRYSAILGNGLENLSDWGIGLGCGLEVLLAGLGCALMLKYGAVQSSEKATTPHEAEVAGAAD